MNNFIQCIAAASLSFLLTGCANETIDVNSQSAEHLHKIGKRGGEIYAVGLDDKFHFEIVPGVIYLLDKDEKEYVADLTTDSSNNEVNIISFKTGETSGFKYKLLNNFTGQFVLHFSINSGDSYRVVLILTGTTNEDEILFLTPGGIYTEADIEKNGRTTPFKKYKDVHIQHDMRPKKGELLCPITMTKVNLNLYWFINGKKYYVCCPPCFTELIKLAKEKPDELLSPEEYIKKQEI